jgi:hypothetical protein
VDETVAMLVLALVQFAAGAPLLCAEAVRTAVWLGATRTDSGATLKPITLGLVYAHTGATLPSGEFTVIG